MEAANIWSQKYVHVRVKSIHYFLTIVYKYSLDRIIDAETDKETKLNAAKPTKSAGSVLTTRETGYHIKQVYNICIYI